MIILPTVDSYYCIAMDYSVAMLALGQEVYFLTSVPKVPNVLLHYFVVQLTEISIITSYFPEQKKYILAGQKVTTILYLMFFNDSTQTILYLNVWTVVSSTANANL